MNVSKKNIEKVLALFDQDDVKYIDLSKYTDYQERQVNVEENKVKKIGEKNGRNSK